MDDVEEFRGNDKIGPPTNQTRDNYQWSICKLNYTQPVASVPTPKKINKLLADKIFLWLKVVFIQ